MEIETREEFEKELICKMCGRPLSFSFRKWDERKDLVELTVSCGVHDGRRRLTVQSFKHLMATGALFGGDIKHDPEEYFKYLRLLKDRVWMANLFGILGILTILPEVIVFLAGLIPLFVILLFNDSILFLLYLWYYMKAKNIEKRMEKFLLNPIV